MRMKQHTFNAQNDNKNPNSVRDKINFLAHS